MNCELERGECSPSHWLQTPEKKRVRITFLRASGSVGVKWIEKYLVINYKHIPRRNWCVEGSLVSCLGLLSLGSLIAQAVIYAPYRIINLGWRSPFKRWTKRRHIRSNFGTFTAEHSPKKAKSSIGEAVFASWQHALECFFLQERKLIVMKMEVLKYSVTPLIFLFSVSNPGGKKNLWRDLTVSGFKVFKSVWRQKWQQWRNRFPNKFPSVTRTLKCARKSKGE